MDSKPKKICEKKNIRSSYQWSPIQESSNFLKKMSLNNSNGNHHFNSKKMKKNEF